MIHDSVPWKSRLVSDANLVERWAAKPSHSERRSFLIEQKVFLAAYAMRKLDDAAKLSTSTLSASTRVQRFAPVRSGYSEVNTHQFDKFFDLDNPTFLDIPNRRLVNLLIHSLVFVEVMGDAETFDAFMVTSDYEQAKGLIQVELPNFIGLMRVVADDYPSVVRRTRDKTTGRWRTWAGHEDSSFGDT